MKSLSTLGNLEYTEEHEAIVRELVARIGILLGHFRNSIVLSKELLRTLWVISSGVLCCKFRNRAFGLESGFS